MPDLRKELENSINNIRGFLDEIKVKNEYRLVGPLSVELRKLLFPGQGNNLLERYAVVVGVDIRFKKRAAPRIPPTYEDCTKDEFLDEFQCFHKNVEYTRRDFINLFANKRGAHVDEQRIPMHEQSDEVHIYGIPWANSYLLSIAENVSNIAHEQLKL